MYVSLNPFSKVKLLHARIPLIGLKRREETGPKVALNHSNRFGKESAILGRQAYLHCHLIAIIVETLILYVYKVKQTQNQKVYLEVIAFFKEARFLASNRSFNITTNHQYL